MFSCVLARPLGKISRDSLLQVVAENAVQGCEFALVQARCRARPAANSALPRPGHQKCSENSSTRFNQGDPGNQSGLLVLVVRSGVSRPRPGALNLLEPDSDMARIGSETRHNSGE